MSVISKSVSEWGPILKRLIIFKIIFYQNVYVLITYEMLYNMNLLLYFSIQKLGVKVGIRTWLVTSNFGRPIQIQNKNILELEPGTPKFSTPCNLRQLNIFLLDTPCANLG